jgi:superfamily I DNA and/or RNA helicase
VVVVDLVRMNENTEIGFLKEIRRMNVALTRAKRLLMVVGDSATIGKHPYYQAFLERVDQVGGYLSVWAIEG